MPASSDIQRLPPIERARLVAVALGIVRVERHPLGPRVYVGGQRVHECATGLALLASSPAFGFAAGRFGLLACVTGCWLTVKDWADLFPATRNTRAWHPVFHRRPPH